MATGASLDQPASALARFMVLLRGVNVGKGNRVPMAGFKRMLQELGYRDVETLLNSGNAVISAAPQPASGIAQVIAAQLTASFGVATPVIVKSTSALAAIVDGCPLVLPAQEHARLLVALGLDDAALRSLEPLAARVQPPDRLLITSGAAYLHCPAGVLGSSIGKAMLGKAGRGVTTRNWATLLKLRALVDAG